MTVSPTRPGASAPTTTTGDRAARQQDDGAESHRPSSIDADRRTRLTAPARPFIISKWLELPPALFVRRILFYAFFYVISPVLQILSRHRYVVYCVPQVPRYYELWQCIMLTGTCLVKRSNANVSIGVAHVDATNVDPSELVGLKQFLVQGIFIINGDVRSNSKDVVQAKFEQAFGYNLAIDPLTHAGPALSKAKKNASRDGRIVECPLLPADIDDHRVYQVLVDNEVDDETTLDYRVPIVGDEIPYVRLVWKSRERRFGKAAVLHTKISETREVFSIEERKEILAMCRALGLDFGALDVVRSRSSGRIYVVDANHTPAPGRRHQSWSGIRLRFRQAESFKRQFLHGGYSRIGSR